MEENMPISDVPDDFLELVERRLSERVQKRITRIYTAIGTVIFAAGGLAAYDIAEDVRQTAIAAAEDAVQGIVNDQVTPVVDTAQSAIDEASEKIMEAQLRIGMVDDALKRIVEKANSAEEKAIETLTQTGHKLTQAEAELSALRDTVGGLHAEANDQLMALRDTFADLATLSSLNADVHSLAQHVGAVDGVVQALVQHASGVSKLDISQLGRLSSSVTPVAESIQSRVEQLQNSGRLTVFFQFAGMSNDLARTISGQLRSKHYVVPGEVRETMDADTQEVRYFRDDDLDQAQRLAADATAALASMGLRELPVEPKRMTDWEGAKPRPHTLELWLSVPEHTRPRELTLSRS
jgi:conjugal transfer/entry exclusion protein